MCLMTNIRARELWVSLFATLAPALAFAAVTADQLKQAGINDCQSNWASRLSQGDMEGAGFGTVNPYGCVGFFQICPGTEKAVSNLSLDQLQNNPQGQAEAFKNYEALRWKDAQRLGLTSLVGQQVCVDYKNGINHCGTVTESSSLAGLQFGPGKLNNLKNGGNCDDRASKDGANTSVCEFMLKGAGSDVSCFTGNPDTGANACPPGTDPNTPTTPSNTGDYQKYVGKYQGVNQECASLTKALDPNLGATSSWQKGAQVQGNANLKPGTPIATFNFGGNYGPPSSPGGASGVSHTGIYLGQDASGVQILDQWNGSGGAHTHTIPWESWNGNSMEAGNKYYTIL